MTHRSLSVSAVLIAFQLVSGCGGYASMSMGGDFGATQGGVQDMGLARELVEAGRVPPPEAFAVEGMFSEHDLPVTGSACESTLCLRGAGGHTTDEAGAEVGAVQVGMSSRIDPATFERPSLTLIACVDVSGSMSGIMDVVKDATARMAAQLGADDQFALVTYGSRVRTRLGLTAGDSPRIASAIGELSSGGSTNMEAGLQRAFAIGRDAVGETDEVRVILYTDVQPNVGATEASDFEMLTGKASADGVSLTVIGAGTGLGQAVMNEMVNFRGGNAFTLFETEHVDTLMADHWPWMVSPIAYDLSVEATLPEGLALSRAWGFPGESASMEVATVFLSKKKGALLFELAPLNEGPLAGSVDLALAWTEPDGTHRETTRTVLLPEATPDFAQASVGEAYALALLVTGMKDAAELYATDAPGAIAGLTAALTRYDADIEDAGKESLAAELTFGQALLELMESGAEQGDTYGL